MCAYRSERLIGKRPNWCVYFSHTKWRELVIMTAGKDKLNKPVCIDYPCDVSKHNFAYKLQGAVGWNVWWWFCKPCFFYGKIPFELFPVHFVTAVICPWGLSKSRRGCLPLISCHKYQLCGEVMEQVYIIYSEEEIDVCVSHSPRTSMLIPGGCHESVHS